MLAKYVFWNNYHNQYHRLIYNRQSEEFSGLIIPALIIYDMFFWQITLNPSNVRDETVVSNVYVCTYLWNLGYV